MSFYEVWNDLLILFRIIWDHILDFIILNIRYIENRLVVIKEENSEDEVSIEISINSYPGQSLRLVLGDLSFLPSKGASFLINLFS